MNEGNRKMAGDLADMIMEALGDDRAPGMLMIVVANESPIDPGRIQVDAACKGLSSHTPLGLELLEQLAERLKASLRIAAAGIHGAVTTIIDRSDINLPGKRGQG